MLPDCRQAGQLPIANERKTAMKKMMLALCCAAMVALFVGGCILIPCGYECESERIVAKREGESGQTQEIVHKKMHLNLFVLGLNPEGGLFGTTYFLYSRFDYRANGNSSEIWAFGHFPLLNYDQWPAVCDLPGTDRWAYITSKVLSADDMEYDESFDRVDRNVLWEKTDNPHIIQVNDRSGKVYINVIAGEESDTIERSNP